MYIRVSLNYISVLWTRETGRRSRTSPDSSCPVAITVKKLGGWSMMVHQACTRKGSYTLNCRGCGDGTKRDLNSAYTVFECL